MSVFAGRGTASELAYQSGHRPRAKPVQERIRPGVQATLAGLVLGDEGEREREVEREREDESEGSVKQRLIKVDR